MSWYLQPLGLKHSFLFPTDAMTHSFAVGHATIADKTIVLRPWQMIRACASAGGIAASMIDQLRYARFHLGDGTAEDGTRILSRESIAMMQTPGDAGMLDIKMGLAWMTRDIGGVRRVFHGGGTYGQISAFTMTPARKFGLALATNSMNGGLLNLDVTKDLVAKFLGNDEPETGRNPDDSLADGGVFGALHAIAGRRYRAQGGSRQADGAGLSKGRISDRGHSARPDATAISSRADR